MGRLFNILKANGFQINKLQKYLRIKVKQSKDKFDETDKNISLLFNNDLILRNEIVQLRHQSETLASLLLERKIFTDEEMNNKLQAILLINNQDITTVN